MKVESIQELIEEIKQARVVNFRRGIYDSRIEMAQYL